MASPLLASSEANESAGPAFASSAQQYPQMALLDFFFPGFSMFAGAVQKYLHIDLNLYLPLLLLTGALTVVWNYASSYLWEQLEAHFMSVVDIRTDDEIYNIIMAWVARQKFSQGSRRFVVNTNLNSRSYRLWNWSDYDEDDEVEELREEESAKKKKALAYTPSFGSHYFWYRGRLLLFRRSSKEKQNSFMLVSQTEEISILCFGRNPWILKELLMEARQMYMKKDAQKTLIYRGTMKPGSMESTWQRCMARANRPFSTVILNEKVKKDLITDVADYLDPATQRWYSLRGIPYRRGYLLHGPPGTGKSSLSLALAGYFKLRIYIVSLSSITSNEESLASLFAELPRRCVVLLEDIDTAGLTHTREGNEPRPQNQSTDDSNSTVPGQLTTGNGNTNNSGGRLSLSGLLNILDGVASQEGRVLIMTTNHLEKLDAALIRPGRVDMIIEFGLADEGMVSSIFRAIFARLDGDDAPDNATQLPLDEDARQRLEEEKAKKRAAETARVNALAEEFAAKIPEHEFSPAELQGFLLKHKRDAEVAVAKAEEFIEKTRKDRKEKQLKEAEENIGRQEGASGEGE
ncbi:BCS1 N terminal-domain-containing protein [Hypoxylon sp. NC0597]|nr:BCS1 N terminal-domain-containing protein [Hypoxylon sp. NC0597]